MELYVSIPVYLYTCIDTYIAEAMKGIDDEQIRCKIFYIMELCLLDQRVPVEDIVANTLLVAVHHCLNPPNIKEHKTCMSMA